jgi:hypothetical protein
MISYVMAGPRKVVDDRGYDSAHGSHHRHFKGETVAVNLKRFEPIEARFQQEWSRLIKEVFRAKD